MTSEQIKKRRKELQKKIDKCKQTIQTLSAKQKKTPKEKQKLTSLKENLANLEDELAGLPELDEDAEVKAPANPPAEEVKAPVNPSAEEVKVSVKPPVEEVKANTQTSVRPGETKLERLIRLMRLNTAQARRVLQTWKYWVDYFCSRANLTNTENKCGPLALGYQMGLLERIAVILSVDSTAYSRRFHDARRELDKELATDETAKHKIDSELIFDWDEFGNYSARANQLIAGERARLKRSEGREGYRRSQLGQLYGFIDELAKHLGPIQVSSIATFEKLATELGIQNVRQYFRADSNGTKQIFLDMDVRTSELQLENDLYRCIESATQAEAMLARIQDMVLVEKICNIIANDLNSVAATQSKYDAVANSNQLYIFFDGHLPTLVEYKDLPIGATLLDSAPAAPPKPPAAPPKPPAGPAAPPKPPAGPADPFIPPPAFLSEGVNIPEDEKFKREIEYMLGFDPNPLREDEATLEAKIAECDTTTKRLEEMVTGVPVTLIFTNKLTQRLKLTELDGKLGEILKVRAKMAQRLRDMKRPAPAAAVPTEYEKTELARLKSEVDKHARIVDMFYTDEESARLRLIDAKTMFRRNGANPPTQQAIDSLDEACEKTAENRKKAQEKLRLAQWEFEKVKIRFVYLQSINMGTVRLPEFKAKPIDYKDSLAAVRNRRAGYETRLNELRALYNTLRQNCDDIERDMVTCKTEGLRVKLDNLQTEVDKERVTLNKCLFLIEDVKTAISALTHHLIEYRSLFPSEDLHIADRKDWMNDMVQGYIQNRAKSSAAIDDARRVADAAAKNAKWQKGSNAAKTSTARKKYEERQNANRTAILELESRIRAQDKDDITFRNHQQREFEDGNITKDQIYTPNLTEADRLRQDKIESIARRDEFTANSTARYIDHVYKGHMEGLAKKEQQVIDGISNKLVKLKSDEDTWSETDDPTGSEPGESTDVTDDTDAEEKSASVKPPAKPKLTALDAEEKSASVKPPAKPKLTWAQSAMNFFGFSVNPADKAEPKKPANDVATVDKAEPKKPANDDSDDENLTFDED